MRAIQISSNGGPEVLTASDIAEPIGDESDLIVDVVAAGVNFIDIYQREGLYPLPLPYTPGLEGAGVVRSVGSSVTQFSPGDRVAWTGHLGSYAEVVALPEDKAVKVPDGVDLETAGGIMLQGLTAHYLVTSVYEVSPGDAAVVHAAAGGVGLLLCQMIRARGGTVIGTVSTGEKAEAALRAGAHHVIRYDRDDIAPTVRQITSGSGVNVVYDGVGKDTFDASLDSLAPRGVLALFGQSSGPVGSFDPQILNQKGSLFLTRPSLTHYTQDSQELRWRASEVFQGLEEGTLSFSLHGTYPLEQASQAHEDLAARLTSGKLLLTI
ncbi:MAG: quinone oxidoreductase [Pontimonas sp.]